VRLVLSKIRIDQGYAVKQVSVKQV